MLFHLKLKYRTNSILPILNRQIMQLLLLKQAQALCNNKNHPQLQTIGGVDKTYQCLMFHTLGHFRIRRMSHFRNSGSFLDHQHATSLSNRRIASLLAIILNKVNWYRYSKWCHPMLYFSLFCVHFYLL